MNAELKAVLKLVFDLEKLIADGIAKKNLSGVIMPDLLMLGTDLPALLQNISDFQNELAGLSDPAAVADLVAFVMAELAGVTSSQHALNIIQASLNLASSLISNSLALAAAIKG